MKLKDKFISGDITIGSWITLESPIVAEIMANAGFDWLTVDLEHSSITLKEAENLIRVIALSGVSPLVRLTSIDKNQIKHVLDSGAEGLIIPMVNYMKMHFRQLNIAYILQKVSVHLVFQSTWLWNKI